METIYRTSCLPRAVESYPYWNNVVSGVDYALAKYFYDCRMDWLVWLLEYRVV